MDFWETKEAELFQRQEEILLRREALLRGREAYYDAQDSRPSSFIADYSKAMQRNQQLLTDINNLSNKMKGETEDLNKYKDFKTLKDNYWVMVRNLFPVWQDEQHQHGSPRLSNRSPQLSNRSPRLSNRSGGFAMPPSPRMGGRSPRVGGRSPSPRIGGRSPSPRVGGRSPSPRPHSSRQQQPMRQSYDTIGSTQETITVPPLELDYSQGDDLTTMSQQLSATKLNTTPKSALASSSSSKAKNKKVQIQEDKKALKEQRKAAEKEAKLERERERQRLKQDKKNKRDSSRSSNRSK